MMARRSLRIFAAVFVLLLIISAFCGCSGWTDMDFSSCEYFAMTDAQGKEYVYAPGEAMFDGAARAFAEASEGTRPDWTLTYGTSLLTEWIQNGHALQFRLYLNPEEPTVYIEDAEGNGFYPTAQGTVFFLSADACRLSFLANFNPEFLLNGQAIDFSVCSFTCVGTVEEESFSLSSDDYLNSSAGEYRLNTREIDISISPTAQTIRHSLYRGTELLVSEAEGIDFAALPAGEYQWIVIVSWQRGALHTRAGYSVTLCP